MSNNLENELGLETQEFLVERKVIQYQPEKFDALGEYLYTNCSVVINRAGVPSVSGSQDWVTFRTPDGSSSFYVKPGEYIVITENNEVLGYTVTELMAAMR